MRLGVLIQCRVRVLILCSRRGFDAAGIFVSHALSPYQLWLEFPISCLDVLLIRSSHNKCEQFCMSLTKVAESAMLCCAMLRRTVFCGAMRIHLMWWCVATPGFETVSGIRLWSIVSGFVFATRSCQVVTIFGLSHDGLLKQHEGAQNVCTRYTEQTNEETNERTKERANERTNKRKCFRIQLCVICSHRNLQWLSKKTRPDERTNERTNEPSKKRNKRTDIGK